MQGQAMKNRGTLRPSSEKSSYHDLTNQAGAGVLLLCSSTRRFLLGRRGAECASPLTWAPFGGMVEPGEHPRDAAVRELYEEARIRPDTVLPTPLYTSVQPKDNFTFYTYLAVCWREYEVSINAESSDYGWFQLFPDGQPYPLHPGFAALIADTAVRNTLTSALKLPR